MGQHYVGQLLKNCLTDDDTCLDYENGAPRCLLCVHMLAHYQRGGDGFQKGALRSYGSQDASVQSFLRYQQNRHFQK